MQKITLGELRAGERATTEFTGAPRATIESAWPTRCSPRSAWTPTSDECYKVVRGNAINAYGLRRFGIHE